MQGRNYREVNMYRSIETHLKLLGIGALLRAVVAKASGHKAYFKLGRDDCQHSFRLRLLSTDVHACEQIFAKKEYLFEVETHPHVIVDAGAYIGLASIYFANRYPDATIIALEPERNNFDLLRENVEPYRNVIPLHAALWNEDTEISVFDPGHGDWGFRTCFKQALAPDRTQLSQAVVAVTIDKLMRDFHLEKIDILKVDIEGAEREVFADSSTWIHKVDAIIIELHDRFKDGCTNAFDAAVRGFGNRWRRGENVYVSRENSERRRTIGMRPAKES
jgi:FkbM family methyltransferase